MEELVVGTATRQQARHESETHRGAHDTDDSHRQPAQVVDSMLEKQAALTPLLRSVEELVVGTATGRSSLCTKFYRHYEASLHHALHDAIAQVWATHSIAVILPVHLASGCMLARVPSWSQMP